MRNDLCDFNDAYIVVTGKITVANPGNDDNVYNRKVSFKHFDPFFNCTLRISSQLIGNVPGVADPANGDDIERELEDIKITVPLKNLSNFIFKLDFLLINSEIELILKWNEDGILTE